MSGFDIIGMGIIFPTIVAIISYILGKQDKKIKDLHSRIIKRLLSFRMHRDEQSFQTLNSLSLEEVLKEIDHILTNGQSSQKDNLRIDVAYNIDGKGKSVLRSLKEEMDTIKTVRVAIWISIIFIIIFYLFIRMLAHRLTRY